MSETAAFDAALAEVEQPASDTFTFHGEPIRVRELCSWLYLKFCKYVSLGASTADPEGQAAIWDVVNDVVLPESRARFEQLVIEHRSTHDELLQFVKQAIAAVAGRPTKPPSSSELSASTDSPKSKSRVIDLGEGRIVEMQPGETTAAATARALRMEAPTDEDDALDGIQEATTLVAEELFS